MSLARETVVIPDRLLGDKSSFYVLRGSIDAVSFSDDLIMVTSAPWLRSDALTELARAARPRLTNCYLLLEPL